MILSPGYVKKKKINCPFSCTKPFEMERIALIHGLLHQKVRQAKDTYKLLIAGMQSSVVNSLFKERTGAS